MDIEVVAFDVFGTLVDWHTSMAAALARVGSRAGIEADWPELANAWRALYHPTLKRVVEGGLPFQPLDVLQGLLLLAVAPYVLVAAATAHTFFRPSQIAESAIVGGFFDTSAVLITAEGHVTINEQLRLFTLLCMQQIVRDLMRDGEPLSYPRVRRVISNRASPACH